MEWSWLKDWWRLKKIKKPVTSEEYEICYCDECLSVSDFFLILSLIKFLWHYIFTE